MAESRIDIARHKIKALNSTNYSIWSKKMQLLLRGKGLWDIVTGKEVAPCTDTQNEDYKTFVQRRDVALTDILLSIEDNCSHAVINFDDPKMVWDKLQEMYKGVSDACIDSYLVKLQDLKMGANEKVMCYVNRLVALENDLSSVGHSLDEKEKKRALLRGLREEFQITAKVIRAMDMNFTKAVSELVVEEGSQGFEPSSEKCSETALTTVHTGKPDCTHCGRGGHTANRCYHNPASEWYKKQIKYGLRKDKKQGKRHGYCRSKKKTKDSLDDDDVANVALMSKSVLRGDVHVPHSMKEKWVIDSASTSHICNNETVFESLTKQPRRPVEVGEGQLVDVHGIGIVRGTTIIDGRKQFVMMKAVLYVPTMMCNLISVSRTRRSGFKVTFDGDKYKNGFCEIMHKETNKAYIKGIELPEGLYEAVFQPEVKTRALVSSSMKQDVWHKRLAHVSSGVISRTIPIVNGIDLQTVKNVPSLRCGDCQVAKSSRQPRPLMTDESRKSTGPLDLVHVDIVGPMKHPSFSGKKYFMPLYDDSCAVSLVRFLQSRNEAGNAIKEMITDLETMRKGRVKQMIITAYGDDRVKRLRTDNAEEFLSRTFRIWLQG